MDSKRGKDVHKQKVSLPLHNYTYLSSREGGWWWVSSTSSHGALLATGIPVPAKQNKGHIHFVTQFKSLWVYMHERVPLIHKHITVRKIIVYVIRLQISAKHTPKAGANISLQ